MATFWSTRTEADRSLGDLPLPLVFVAFFARELFAEWHFRCWLTTNTILVPMFVLTSRFKDGETCLQSVVFVILTNHPRAKRRGRFSKAQSWACTLTTVLMRRVRGRRSDLPCLQQWTSHVDQTWGPMGQHGLGSMSALVCISIQSRE